jgi:hypothetical protein
MSENDNLVVGNITIVQNEPLTDRPLVPAHPPISAHPWNTTIPLPMKPEPKPAPMYRLTVRHESTMVTGSEELVSCKAECHSRDQLLDLSAQFEAINYHFISLELIEPA